MNRGEKSLHFTRRNIGLLVFGILAGGVITISVRQHILPLLLISTTARLFALIALLFLVLSAGITLWAGRFLDVYPARKVLPWAALVVGLTLTLMVNFMISPPYVLEENHLLTISITEDRNPASHGSQAKLVEVKLDGGVLPADQFQCNEGAYKPPEALWLRGGELNEINCKFVAKAGGQVDLLFGEGPDSGKMLLKIDGQDAQTTPALIDLYSPQAGARLLRVEVPVVWKDYLFTAADVLAVILLVFMAGISVNALAERRRGIMLGVGCLVLIVCIGFNFNDFFGSGLPTRIQYGSLTGYDFVHNSVAVEEFNFAYAFSPYLRARELAIMPGVVETAGWKRVSERGVGFLKQLLSLSDVSLEPENRALSASEEQAIMKAASIEWPCGSGGKYILIRGRGDAVSKYVVQTSGNDILVYPDGMRGGN